MTLQERGLQSEAKDIVEALVEYPTAPPTVLDRAVLLHHEEEYLEALQVLIDHDAHDAYARIDDCVPVTGRTREWIGSQGLGRSRSRYRTGLINQ